MFWKRKKKKEKASKKKKVKKKRKLSGATTVEAPKYDDRRLRKDILIYLSDGKEVSYKGIEGLGKERAVSVANRLVDEGRLETFMRYDEKIGCAARFYRLLRKGDTS